MIKITTLQFPGGSQQHEFDEGSIVADLLAKIGSNHIIKKDGQVIENTAPLTNGVYGVQVVNETGTREIKKVAGAGDKKAMKKVMEMLEAMQQEDMEDDFDDEDEEIEGTVRFTAERSKKIVEFKESGRLPTGSKVIDILNGYGIPLDGVKIKVNGEKASLGTVIYDGDKIKF